jgi:AGZA family xanthine/uracil permease-like MFS transporter
VDHVFSGFEFLGIILVTAIPFGIYDLVEAMDNVESAEAAGDPYPTTRVLTADGVVSLIGCLMGNPFINAVYIGHPGWKLGQVGVLYHGLEVLGGGSILTGLVLGAIGVFVIEKKFAEAAAFALSGALLTFFGFMHGESVGLAVTPTVAIAYVIVAVFFFGLAQAPAMQSAPSALAENAVAATPAE